MESFSTPAHQADELLETLLNVSLTGVIFFQPLYDSDGTSIIDFAYLRLNPAAQGMLQLPQRPQETFLTLYPHAKETGIFTFYRDTYLSGKANRYGVHYSYDGLDNYFLLSAQPSGSLLVVSFSDTADYDRSAAEQALRESQAREKKAREDAELQRQQLHNLFMQAPALICLFEGPQHVFKLVNPPYQKLVGERPLLEKPIREAMPELEGQPIFGLLDQVYQTGESFYAYEQLVQLDHENSGQMGHNYYNFIYQPLRSLSGQVEGILVFAYQVSALVEARKKVLTLNEQLEARVATRTGELKAANEQILSTNEELSESNGQLLRTNTQLQRVNNDLDNFVYTASHDLRAPISNIEGLLKALERELRKHEPQKGKVEHLFSLLNGSVNRFKLTISELTDVARISKESPEDVASISISEVLEEVILDLTSPIREAQAHVEVSIADQRVHFSRKNLKSILYNLLSNAVKYRSTERAPFIDIRFGWEAGSIVLQVEDNGLGMDMSQKEKIFALFKRLHTHVEGTGIGLYIVKRILENAGGRIEVESQVGVGSTFKVYFKQYP